MKLSKLLAPTLREVPSEAEVISHKLMLRAGMIQKLASGIYNLLPLGFRVVQKVSQIIREEMNRAGAQEILMPTLLPSDLWEETERWNVYGKELFRITDRHDREYCLGPTHEEIVTDIVRKHIKSYRKLPINLYQIQNKFRDEIRPRFGVMRSREFSMKDAYSFHASDECAEKEYKNMYETYCRIFSRLGLEYRVVEADPGAIGGGFSQEFMVLADSGEEELYYCEKCGYAASKDGCAIGKPKESKSNYTKEKLAEVHTPDAKTIEEVTKFLNAKPDQMIKTIIYKTENGIVLALVRGDHAINEIKLRKILGASDLVLADAKTIKEISGAEVGFAGPHSLKGVKIIADQNVALIEDGITGANKTDYHVTHLVYGRDYKADITADIRYAIEADNCPKCEAVFKVCRGIEVGHIFKLGTKYSDKMKAVFIDENNKEKTCIMGCYGIGVGRTAAAAIEQNHDQDGIIWPLSIAPYQVALIVADMSKNEQKEIADKLYADLLSRNIEVLYDDRDDRLGAKLKDIDLMGIPIKLIVAPKALKENKIELKLRKYNKTELIPVEQIASIVEETVKIK